MFAVFIKVLRKTEASMGMPRVRSMENGYVSTTKILETTTVTQSNRMYFNPATANTVTTTQTFTGVDSGNRQTTIDRVTPGFYKLMKSGAIINNPLSIMKEAYVNQPVDIWTEVTDYRYEMSIPENYAVGIYPYQIKTISGVVPTTALLATSGVTFLSPPSGVDEEIVRARAVTKAHAAINESDMLALASVKESGKTARDLTLLARKVLKAIKFVRHPTTSLREITSLKKMKNYVAEAEDLYMQARYSLRPLYHDIMGTMKVATGTSDAKRATRTHDDRYTIRGTATDSDIISDSVEITSSLLPYHTLNVLRTSSTEVEARAGVLCQARDMTRWEQSGISLLPETAWELTPFSFIADWFGNFGEVISSWAPKPGVSILSSWVTSELTVTQRLQVSVASVLNAYPHATNLGLIYERITTPAYVNGTYEVSTSTRTRLPNPGRPISPHLSFNIDALKTLDLAIIGKNISKSIKRWRL